MKEIYIKTDFIKLGQLLKYIGLVSNGSDVKQFLIENKILVNNELEQRRGRKIEPNFILLINNEEFLIKKG